MNIVDLFGDSGTNGGETFSSEAFPRVIKLCLCRRRMETFSVVFSKGRQLRCNNNQLEIYSDLLLGGDSYPLTKGL